MKKVYRSALCACLAGFVLASCEPEAPYKRDEDPAISNPDVFILCEGLWQANNADISAYKSDSLLCTPEYYLAQNGQYLGDTGQDILYHKGYLYVSVYGSSYVTKLDIEGNELARHPFSAEEGQPRYLTADGDYIYVTLYSGKVAKMKADDLSVVDYAPVGLNPEDIILHKGQLLVANSGWGADSTLTVIDVATFKPVKTIHVAHNPQRLVISGDSVYLLAYGKDYNTIIQSVDVSRETARTITHATHAVAYDNTLYMCNSVTDYTTAQTTNTFFTYDVTTTILDSMNFLQGDVAEVLSNPVYMMEVNPKNGDFYIGLAGTKFVSSGMIHRCDKDGRLIHRFDVGGANPNQAAFVNYE